MWKSRLDEPRRLRGQTSEGELLRRFWKPGGIVDKGNERRLKQWLQKNGIGAESLTLSLRSKGFAEARKRAVEELKLSTQDVVMLKKGC